MTFLYAVLLGIILIAIGGHVVMWVFAYQEVRNIESWSQQSRVLGGWWIFDKDLLPKEHDHLRVTALWCTVVYSACSLLLWYLYSRFG